VRALCFILCAATLAAPQVERRPSLYILRISHVTFGDSSCALLQEDGTFHLELARGEDTKVFEGTTSRDDVIKVQQWLADSRLTALSQEQIEEPIVRGRIEKLQLTIFRRDHWQDLYFQSDESEEPFKQSLDPLVRWLDGLHKLPHKEFSEDEGKQNCLPPRKIELTKRDPNPPPPQSNASTDWAIKSILKTPALAPPVPTSPVPVRPLLRVYSLVRTTNDARQSCMLVADNGRYRFENHYQKTGRAVSSEITAGKLNTEELAQLRVILDNSALAKIAHREPRGSAPVPMLGDMLNLSITRAQGEQNIILSSRFGREFGIFYGGDADTAVARDLTDFLKEHIENAGRETLSKSARNDCTELP
jgi:hypothetical protein